MSNEQNNSITLSELQDKLSFAWQLDLEMGSAWLNEQELVKFAERYPGLDKVIGMIMDLDSIDPEK